MTRQFTNIFTTTAYAALTALLLLASVADAHRNSANDQYRNQYLQLICEATASTASTDPNPLAPHVAVGEICRVATSTSSVLTPYSATNTGSEFTTHNSNARSIHDRYTGRPGGGSVNHTGLVHLNGRYRWVIEPPGDDGTCTGDPTTTGTKSVPSGGADGYIAPVTSSTTFFAASGSNQTYTVAAEDEGKCIYALVYFDESRQASVTNRIFHHATINPRNNFGSPPNGQTAFNGNVIVQAMGTMPSTNTVATGNPTVTPDPATEDGEMTAATTGITDDDGINASTVTWQWQSADAPETGVPADGDYADITGETGNTFTPGDDEAGRFVRACASFMDNHATPNSEGPLCSVPTAAVVNINDAPTGAITIQAKGDSSATTGLTEVMVGSEYDVGETTGGGNIGDPDGNPTILRKSWQRSQRWHNLDRGGDFPHRHRRRKLLHSGGGRPHRRKPARLRVLH